MKRTCILDTGSMWGFETASMFKSLNPFIWSPRNEYELFSIIRNAEDIDFALFGGGADVSPGCYGHNNLGSYCQERRDTIEIQTWELLQEKEIPILGICRGSQFSCVMSGGTLIQDCDNHGVTHNITTNSGETFSITSTHHQMMYPWDVRHKLIAWASPSRSSRYIYDGVKCAFDKEPEIVFFPETRALAVQGHPEYMASNSKAVKFVLELVNKLVTNPAEI